MIEAVKARWETWKRKRRIKDLKKRLRMQLLAAQGCIDAGNESGSQIHFAQARKLYAKLRQVDPTCPPWINNRQERRKAMRDRRKQRGVAPYGPGLKSDKARQVASGNRKSP